MSLSFHHLILNSIFRTFVNIGICYQRSRCYPNDLFTNDGGDVFVVGLGRFKKIQRTDGWMDGVVK